MAIAVRWRPRLGRDALGGRPGWLVAPERLRGRVRGRLLSSLAPVNVIMWKRSETQEWHESFDIFDMTGVCLNFKHFPNNFTPKWIDLYQSVKGSSISYSNLIVYNLSCCLPRNFAAKFFSSLLIRGNPLPRSPMENHLSWTLNRASTVACGSCLGRHGSSNLRFRLWSPER